MKTQMIGTLALLVAMGLAPEALADQPQKLGATLSPVANEAELQQLMMQNRARIAAQYRGDQAETGDQTRLQDGDGTKNQYRNQHRNQHRNQTGTATGDRTQLRQQLRTEIRSTLRAQRDTDQLAAKLRYQIRERQQVGESGMQGDAGAGQRPDNRRAGHGR